MNCGHRASSVMDRPLNQLSVVQGRNRTTDRLVLVLGSSHLDIFFFLSFHVASRGYSNILRNYMGYCCTPLLTPFYSVSSFPFHLSSFIFHLVGLGLDLGVGFGLGLGPSNALYTNASVRSILLSTQRCHPSSYPAPTYLPTHLPIYLPN